MNAKICTAQRRYFRMVYDVRQIYHRLNILSQKNGRENKRSHFCLWRCTKPAPIQPQTRRQRSAIIFRFSFYTSILLTLILFLGDTALLTFRRFLLCPFSRRIWILPPFLSLLHLPFLISTSLILRAILVPSPLRLPILPLPHLLPSLLLHCILLILR